jgi:hypothetical protein
VGQASVVLPDEVLDFENCLLGGADEPKTTFPQYNKA